MTVRIAILLFSVIIAYIAQLSEQAIGLDWRFHPDAVLYVEHYKELPLTLESIPNNLYFVLVYLFQGDKDNLIFLNIIVYSLTNLVAFNIVTKNLDNTVDLSNSKLAFLVFLLEPYRIHLSIHVLKDTIIIFFCLLVVGGVNKKTKLFSFIVMILLRISSLLYCIVLLPERILYISFIFILMSAIIVPEVGDFLNERNLADMGGRSDFIIENFAYLGPIGALIRAFIWPCLLISGGFFLFAPAIYALPIMLELLVQRIFCKLINKSVFLSFGQFLVLFIIGLVINSFGAYLRYCYPVVCLIPIMENRKNA